ESDDDPMRSCESLRTILPASPNMPYDMKKVISEVVDNGEFFEYFPNWAKSIVCGFSRIDGHSVGVVGNQPTVLAGVLISGQCTAETGLPNRCGRPLDHRMRVSANCQIHCDCRPPDVLVWGRNEIIRDDLAPSIRSVRKPDVRLGLTVSARDEFDEFADRDEFDPSYLIRVRPERVEWQGSLP
ncbi:MAG: hypothetical protein EBZ89_07175, partial [Chloroflexi bacterium]|nr:hypothetical protein [Chloroflexota bacterium]